MIKIVKGDLLEAKEDIIGHQVNCQGKMNSGVAKSIREKYPQAYKMYMDKCHANGGQALGTHRMLGDMQIVNVLHDKRVANLFGQNNYGYDNKKYTDEENLLIAFIELRKYAEHFNLSVALPYMIGCYRGGGDWKIVEDYLMIAFEGYEVTLYKHHVG